MVEPKYIRSCSIWRALEVLGDTPTLLLHESYWMGTRRFSDFQRQTGLLKTVISDRLSKLIAAGCLTKELYSERPKRYEYRATQKFYELYPVALTMLHWERKWGKKDGKIDIRLIHKSCGQATSPSMVCRCCHAPINARDVEWAEGPGIGLMPAEYSRRRRQSAPPGESGTRLFDGISNIIGDRWSTLIIRSVFTNLNSYQEIRDDSDIATNILAERLTWLCEDGILEKTVHRENASKTYYKLTEKGRDIYPILIAVMEWGDKWYASPEGPPLILSHKLCGESLHALMACDVCGEEVTARDVDFVIKEHAEKEHAEKAFPAPAS